MTAARKPEPVEAEVVAESVAVMRREIDPGDSLIALAVEKNLDIDKLERLFAMRRQDRADEAARQFAVAMADFQKRCPIIDKGKLVHYVTKSGVTIHYKHAELKHIQAVIKPLCGEVGLSYSWSNIIEGGKLTTTCTVLHAGGHSRGASFTCPVENSNPGMSDQQKPASALTFGERYTIIQAFGLVTGEPDLDGEQGGGAKAATITAQQADDLRALAEEVHIKVERILKAAHVERLEDITVAHFPEIVATLQAKRQKPEAAK
jgi:hypothetical protein